MLEHPRPHQMSIRPTLRRMTAVALITTCMFTSGCWDRTEIQDRGMVKALAVDVVEDDNDSPATQQIENFAQPHGTKQFLLSVELVRLGGGHQQGKGAAESNTFTVKSRGRSLSEMKRDMLGQISKILDFGHMDAIIFSEAVLRQEGLRPLIDSFLRDPSIRWRIRVYITPGTARSVLEYHTPTGETVGQFLAATATNQTLNAHMPVARTDLGYITVALDNGGDVILPRVEVAEKVLKIGGGAIFHKDKFAGYIDEVTVQGWRLASGLLKSAVITISCQDHPEKLIAFEITDFSSTLEPHVDGDQIYFTVDVKAIGNLAEFQCINEHGPVAAKDIPKLENQFAEEITNTISASLHTMQALNYDPSGGVAEQLKTRHRETWMKIKDRWPEVYPTIPFYVTSRVTIQNIGEHR